jgi:hypothetical protein
MMGPDEIREMLHRLAGEFENVVQPKDALGRGWGQFLNTPAGHRQVGLYGTCSGVLVLSLASRGNSAVLKDAVSLLRHWWTNRDRDAYASERLVQTVRMAFLVLSMRLSGLASSEDLNGIEQALLGMLLPANMWGDFYLSEAVNDPTPRNASSAVAVIALSLLRDETSKLDGRVLEVVDQLERKLAASADLPQLDLALMSVAVLSVKGSTARRQALSTIRGLGHAVGMRLDTTLAYYYPYQWRAGANGSENYANDYFIVAPELLLAIAGLLPGAPGALRLRAEATLRALSASLSTGGTFSQRDRQLISTIDQVWAALLLRLAQGRTSSIPAGQHIWYFLARERRNNWFTERVLPIVFLIAITVENVTFKGLTSWLDAFMAVCALFIGGLYAPSMIRRLLPGRL